MMTMMKITELICDFCPSKFLHYPSCPATRSFCRNAGNLAIRALLSQYRKCCNLRAIEAIIFGKLYIILDDLDIFFEN